jgi:hypothetical protein
MPPVAVAARGAGAGAGKENENAAMPPPSTVNKGMRRRLQYVQRQC